MPPARISRVELSGQREALGRDLDDAIERVLASGHFILGPEVEAFESEFASYCGTLYCVSTGSGTDALRLALAGYGVGPEDEVITVAHTAVPTAFAIEATGATPVFVDVDPTTHTMDPVSARVAITERTRAIVPVHLYGRSAALDPLLELAATHGLRVIEDACQAHGASHGSRRVGSVGHAGCFSFYPTKNLGAYGDGGAVVTDDEGLAERLRLLRNHGLSGGYVHELPAVNSRLDELQAAILRSKLSRLDSWNDARRRLAAVYQRELTGLPVVLPDPGQTREHVFHLFVIRTPRREELLDHLRANGIEAGVHYPAPAHRQPAYAGTPQARTDLPVTEEISGELLSLPMYPELAEESVVRVAACVREFFGADAS